MVESNRRSVVFQLRSLSGGIGVVVARLATEFERLGVDVSVLCEKPVTGSVSVLPATINVECTGSTMKARGFLRLLAYLRRRRPDHVITNDRRANVAAITAKRILLSRAAITSVVHDTYSIAMRSKSEHDKRTQLRHYRQFYRYNDRIISVSRGAREDFAALANIAPDSIDVIYNPLPPRSELETPAAPSGHRWLIPEKTVPVIVGAGRLQREQKNFALLLRAFSLLQKQRKARLIIIGEGRDRERLERLATDLGIQQDVDMPGWQQNAYAFFRESSVYAHCSVHEGFGLAISEALALGTRVVATDCPHGPREILDDGRLGLLVPPGDESAMAVALASALEMPRPDADLLEEHKRRFDVTSIAHQYLTLLGIEPR